MTNEQIAALRALINRNESSDAQTDEICLTLPEMCQLLDHIANLEADARRYQWLKSKGHLNDWWSVQDDDRDIGVDKSIDEHLDELNDEQRHAEVAKILKEE